MPKRFLWLFRRDAVAFGYAASSLVRFYLIFGSLLAFTVTVWGTSVVWGRVTPGSLLLLSDVVAVMGLIIGGVTICVTAIRIMFTDLHLIVRGELNILAQTLTELVESLEQSKEFHRERDEHPQASDAKPAAYAGSTPK